MADLSPELLENYRALAESRDWSLSQMADDLESRDADAAAELRKADDSKAKKRDDAPKSRRSAGPKSEA